MNDITEMLKGVLEGLILDVIGQESTYGYEITQRLKSYGFEDIVEGTIYTILLRLEKSGDVSFQKIPSEKGPPRKFYSLTYTGTESLRTFWEKWDFVSNTITTIRSK